VIDTGLSVSCIKWSSAAELRVRQWRLHAHDGRGYELNDRSRQGLVLAIAGTKIGSNPPQHEVQFFTPHRKVAAALAALAVLAAGP
jgi:hypothetical protein